MMTRRALAALGLPLVFFGEAYAQPTGTNTPSSANPAPNTQAVSAYTFSPTDVSVINNYSTGAVTWTLPIVSGNIGRWLHVQTVRAVAVSSAAANVVLIGTTVATTVLLVNTAGKWAELQSDGTNWIVMASN